MRKDINILWIDDTPSWQKQEQELFGLHVSDFGLLYDITYISSADEMIDRLTCEEDGFKVYDIIFVDYNISSKYKGNQVIKRLRDHNIDADVLFYSANPSSDIKTEATESGLAFDGVYYAERDDFQNKAIALYRKNIRNLLSLSNVRGFIMDKTSEIDFVINSYIAEKYYKLSELQKGEFLDLLRKQVDKNIDEQNSRQEALEKELEKNDLNMNRIISAARDTLSQPSRFELFNFLIKIFVHEGVVTHSMEDYKKEIIATRNKVAHKKLDISNCQKYIMYYDNIRQYLERQCPNDCDLHSNDSKISLDQWLSLVKNTNEYVKWFSDMFADLLSEKALQKQG